MAVRARREPPPFRPVEVRAVEPRGPRLVRVTLAGESLDGFAVDQPAASVRLLLPSPGSSEVVMPAWNGNEFLLPDGTRPVIRTFTPRRTSGDELDLEVVVHGGGAASTWAAAAAPGLAAAISGPGRGYTIDPEATSFLLAGDETAIPAIGQLLEWLPPSVTIEVHVEVAAPEGRVELPAHPAASVRWHDLPTAGAPGDAMFAAVTSAPPFGEGARLWVAGEAAGVQRVRRHLFEERGLPRGQASVRGYWKRGRSGDADAGP